LAASDRRPPDDRSEIQQIPPKSEVPSDERPVDQQTAKNARFRIFGMLKRNSARRLIDLPLWRLIVALDDAERTVGPDSPTALTLAQALRQRLRREKGPEVKDPKRSD
jgi:hypothetical protein